MKNVIKKTFQFLGANISNYPTPFIKSRINILKEYNIDALIDIGANKGQFAKEIRKFGYANKIVSFEPLTDIYSLIKLKSDKDDKWVVVQKAIGNYDGETEINVAKNTASSSILDILPIHIENAPDSVFIKKDKVPISRIDTIINEYTDENDRLFIKSDTQGYEKNVIEGCEKILDRVYGFQLELSLQSMYEGEPAFNELLNLLVSKGYFIYSLEPTFYSMKKGQLFQVDALFVKENR